MPQPENEETRPVVSGTGLENDLLAGGVEVNDTASDLTDQIADAAELTVASALLLSPTVDHAKRLLALAAVPVSSDDRVEWIPAAAFTHPTAKFVADVSTRLVEDLVPPAPVTVVTYAMQHKMSLPDRHTPIAALSKLAAASHVTAAADWAAREVRNNYFRRAIATAGQRISSAAWADTAEMAELVKREIAAITDAVEAVKG
ncbi:hypothetical protein FDO65_06995 [Nakamurella flava]|uniref:Uncharacterized protein n=1 Tax=Nakamurella flava TaxID=2576308 RepID=A0A4U6QMG0_9ACTN|nr:hypothetical protein [Nakamurella flava]TKV61338.1 hypothetical protein FDO65_06995 [Nakamurella flava]